MPNPTRTPEGEPIRCHVCGKSSSIEPSLFTGDALCPNCGTLVWTAPTIRSAELVELIKNRLKLQSVPSPARQQHRQNSGERLRKIGVTGGLASVWGFFSLLVLFASTGNPDQWSRGSLLPYIFATCVISVFAGCILSLLAILAGAIASEQ
jgi:hypothetical protein